MDIPRPENFNECYLYEGMYTLRGTMETETQRLTMPQSSWSATWLPSSGLASP